ncbi:uncharacterized protein K02A2.6-like [Octopus bimaculoides]|uniref:uncharacterized protein K02A2.6-like n=1 Tax=Octopus bimaculoides TaxID=37653 RepID=UPI00071C2717|nr:uncharacterized protein K02A2.6-like [Octopus bimaculoides]|eukprot:XP_014771399.1 PREDICTED: uncharacterized protein K02A2.6-like [Octopus bimaculoides]
MNVLDKPVLSKTTKAARDVLGRKLLFRGEFNYNVTFQVRKIKAKAFELNNFNNLFGTNWIEKFDLCDLPINHYCKNVIGTGTSSNTDLDKLQKELKKVFPDVFSDELGACLKTKAKFEIKKNAIPIFKPKRNVPYTVLDQINLERLEKIGVIQKLAYSKWASSTVYVKKKNKIRLCADFFTGLNKCLKMFNYPLPTPEDIFAKLDSGKIFSKLDLSDAYLQIRVDHECSKYLTINTHKGLYKYNRLSFGLKVTLVIFQQIMDAKLANCEFTIAYLDDILIKSGSRC